MAATAAARARAGYSATLLAKKLGVLAGNRVCLVDSPLDDYRAVVVRWPEGAVVALPLGCVDVKVCAVDAVWSGLKLVVRRELRA